MAPGLKGEIGAVVFFFFLFWGCIKANVPCKFFTGAQGSCKQGYYCPYLHAETLRNSTAAAATGGNFTDKDDQDDPFQMTLPPMQMQQQQQQQRHAPPRGGGGGRSNAVPLRQQQPPQRRQQQRQPQQQQQTAFSELLARAQSTPAHQQQQQPQRIIVQHRRSVRVPWDPTVTYQCKFTKQQRPLWGTYKTFLLEECASVGDFFSMLAELLSVGVNKKRSPSSFPALVSALRTMPDDDFVSRKFLPRILPKLQDYVLAAPGLFPEPIPVLQQRDDQHPDIPDKVALTQLQCSALLAVGFFGLFPLRALGDRFQADAPGCNLTAMYGLGGASPAEKIKCILGYFDTVTDPSVALPRERAALDAFRVAGGGLSSSSNSNSNSNSPTGRCLGRGAGAAVAGGGGRASRGVFENDDDDLDDDDNAGIESSESRSNSNLGGGAAGAASSSTTTFVVEFIRTRLEDSDAMFDDMIESTKPLAKVTMHDKGVIESNGNKMVQADFANKVIGGGVLGYGCVQEEIRFAISPELLLSRLMMEDMLDDEAITMSGSLIYANYIGYGHQFQYAGRVWPLPPPTPAEARAGIRDVAVVAFDAINFSPKVDIGPQDQYRWFWVQRELLKAYAAFLPVPSSQCASASNPECAIATGNWGCGVFRGDLELKFAVQLVAASEAGRALRYFTFGNTALADSAEMFIDMLDEAGIGSQQLLSMLGAWSRMHEAQMDRQRIQQEEGDDDDDVVVAMAKRKSTTTNNKKKPMQQQKSSSSMTINLVDDDDGEDSDTGTIDFVVDSDDDDDNGVVPLQRKPLISKTNNDAERQKELKSFFYYVSNCIAEQKQQ